MPERWADSSDDGFEFVVYDGRCRLGFGVDGSGMADDSRSRILLFGPCKEEVGVIAYLAEFDVCRRGFFSGISCFSLLLPSPFASIPFHLVCSWIARTDCSGGYGATL